MSILASGKSRLRKKKGKKKKKDQLGCVYKSLWIFEMVIGVCVFLLTLLPLLEDTNNVVRLLLLFLSLSSLLCELG